jgi:radical SAM protein with 4Fe4S-binding SPASM domain
MEQELFKKIIAQGKDLALEAVFHVLGEPLLHPELEFFIDHTHEAGLSINLTTNGTLLNAAMSEMLTNKKLRQINISLQAIQELAEQEKYFKQILSFIKTAQKNNPDGYINLRLWNVLTNDSTKIIGMLNEYFNKHIVLPTTLTELKNWKSYPLDNRVYLHIDTQFFWPDIDQPIRQTQGFCYGVSSHVGVLVDGTVVPCCLDGAGVIKLGNIKNNTLTEILDSKRAKAMEKGFSQRLLMEPLCQRCGYIERFAKL